MTTTSCYWPPSCSRSSRGVQRLAENAKGGRGRALLTAFPGLFQTAQGSEQATLISSYKPASLTGHF